MNNSTTITWTQCCHEKFELEEVDADFKRIEFFASIERVADGWHWTIWPKESRCISGSVPFNKDDVANRRWALGIARHLVIEASIAVRPYLARKLYDNGMVSRSPHEAKHAPADCSTVQH